MMDTVINGDYGSDSIVILTLAIGNRGGCRVSMSRTRTYSGEKRVAQYHPRLYTRALNACNF